MRVECGLLSSTKACESPEHAAKTSNRSPCLSTVEGLPLCSLGFINTTPFVIGVERFNGWSAISYHIQCRGGLSDGSGDLLEKGICQGWPDCRAPSAYCSLSIAPSTVSLMVATNAFVANYMFLLVKNRSSVCPRIHWRQIVKHAAARQLMPTSQQAIGVVLVTRLMMIAESDIGPREPQGPGLRIRTRSK